MAIWVRFQTGGHWKFYTHLCALQESTCTRFLRAEKKKKRWETSYGLWPRALENLRHHPRVQQELFGHAWWYKPAAPLQEAEAGASLDPSN